MKKIAVIGSVNMDMTVQSDRIPRPGETVSGRSLTYNPGGKGANQAVAAARLGGDVTFFGCVGDDSFGEQLLANLSSNGVHTEHIAKVPGQSTGLAMIAVAESDNAIVVVPGANQCVTPAYLEREKDHLLQADILVLQNEIPAETVEAAIRLGRAAGKYIIYDPAPARAVSPEILAMVDCLTPNEHEAGLLFPGEEFGDSLLLAHPGKLLITLGAEGAKTVLPGGELVHVPAYPVNVVDTTGAGDTFTGALATALAKGNSFTDAMRFANAAGGLSTTALGAQAAMPTAQQVEAVLNRKP